ncbi:hypothetical protein Dimus_026449, partial [Dionaea muscipula]
SEEAASKGEADTLVDKVVEEIVTSLGQPTKAQGMEMILYEKPMATEFSQPTPFIHDHFQQAIRGILNEMEQQNEGIKELFGLLESKVLIDNQKERLTWGKLDEAKGFLKNISIAITTLSTAIEETMTTVAEKISEHLNDQTENVK